MNNRPFVRKIIYIACIGALIIPLSFVSLPETRESSGKIKNAGGQLSQLREKYDLSQAKMSEIDPASETMKLASLGLRGVAVNILWMQAEEHRKNENYDQLASTLKALTKIQPNFIKVWEYQAHNLAYNVSMEFDDYEYRYSWVKKGLEFLKQGIPYNKRDHRVTDNLGFFTGNKFGKSDEKDSFRRLFRLDDEFHQAMSDRIDPESYENSYGYDSWRMAYQWYDFSRKMVDDQGCPQYRSDLMFYMFRPSQRRNEALSLQQEFPTDVVIQEIWRDANEEWKGYGEQKISNTLGTTITLEGMEAEQDRLDAYREQLDELVPPGARQGMIEDLANDLQLSDEDKAMLKMPVDEMTDLEVRQVRALKNRLAEMDTMLDSKIALQASAENRFEANRLALDIGVVQQEIRTIDQDALTVNYPYWRTRNEVESQDPTVVAQEALYQAQQVWRQSIYDDEYDFDYRTKVKTITKKGAITLYLEAFELWRPILDQNPRLYEGQLGDELVLHIREYQRMMLVSNREWPLDFPLQPLIDRRFDAGEKDGLPTTLYLKEMRMGQEPTDNQPDAAAPTDGAGQDDVQADDKAGN